MTFSSVYEMFDPLTTVRKQRFWDFFDGDDLRSWWTTNNIQGTPTFQMADVVDEGFEIITGATANDGGQILFNNIRQYSNTASMMISVIRALSNASQSAEVGLRQVISGLNFALVGQKTDSSTTDYIIDTSDATTRTQTVATFALDTVFHVHQLELTSANAKYSIDGGLEVTKTTNLPTLKLQPVYFVQTLTTVAKTGRIRYLEVFNT